MDERELARGLRYAKQNLLPWKPTCQKRQASILAWPMSDGGSSFSSPDVTAHDPIKHLAQITLCKPSATGGIIASTSAFCDFCLELSGAAQEGRG